MSGSQLFVLWVALQIGSLIYVAFSSGDYARLLDRAFFQGVALLAAWLVPLIAERAK